MRTPVGDSWGSRSYNMDGESTSLGLTWFGSIERLNWFSKDVMKFIP
jgi:hypothetical protein